MPYKNVRVYRDVDASLLIDKEAQKYCMGVLGGDARFGGSDYFEISKNEAEIFLGDENMAKAFVKRVREDLESHRHLLSIAIDYA